MHRLPCSRAALEGLTLQLWWPVHRLCAKRACRTQGKLSCTSRSGWRLQQLTWRSGAWPHLLPATGLQAATGLLLDGGCRAASPQTPASSTAAVLRASCIAHRAACSIVLEANDEQLCTTKDQYEADWCPAKGRMRCAKVGSRGVVLGSPVDLFVVCCGTHLLNLPETLQPDAGGWQCIKLAQSLFCDTQGPHTATYNLTLPYPEVRGMQRQRALRQPRLHHQPRSPIASSALYADGAAHPEAEGMQRQRALRQPRGCITSRTALSTIQSGLFCGWAPDQAAQGQLQRMRGDARRERRAASLSRCLGLQPGATERGCVRLRLPS